jgi:hypothetical protein
MTGGAMQRLILPPLEKPANALKTCRQSLPAQCRRKGIPAERKTGAAFLQLLPFFIILLFRIAFRKLSPSASSLHPLT